MKGEWVRSKGECVIANYFYGHNINYKYERPAYTDDFWLFSEEISRPDFYLPDYKVFVEYWGLMDAKEYKTRIAYRRGMAYKMEQYNLNNIRFISLYPNNIRPESVLHQTFSERLDEIIGRQRKKSGKQGYCIRSGDGIPFNLGRPLCLDCYRKWAEYENRNYGEIYCHSCGNEAETTFAKPLCRTC